VGMFSRFRAAMACKPSAVAGILMFTFGAQAALTRASFIMAAASSASTSTETGPEMMLQMLLTTVL